MRQGTAPAESFVIGAPHVDVLATEPLVLAGATVLQVGFEISAEGSGALLPPALHPVSPPVVLWSFLAVRESDLGPFALAEARLLCRSGVRTRGLIVGGFVDSPDVSVHLRERWGMPFRVGSIEVERRYDGASGRVSDANGALVLDTGMRHAVDLRAGDVQYAATIHTVVLPRGPRLVHVERDHVIEVAERGAADLHGFDAAAFGDARIVPTTPIAASAAVADVTIKAPRHVCRLDLTAFEGTEALDR